MSPIGISIQLSVQSPLSSEHVCWLLPFVECADPRNRANALLPFTILVSLPSLLLLLPFLSPPTSLETNSSKKYPMTTPAQMLTGLFRSMVNSLLVKHYLVEMINVPFTSKTKMLSQKTLSKVLALQMKTEKMSIPMFLTAQLWKAPKTTMLG